MVRIFFKVLFRILLAAGTALGLLALWVFLTDAPSDYIQIFEDGEEDN